MYLFADPYIFFIALPHPFLIHLATQRESSRKLPPRALRSCNCAKAPDGAFFIYCRQEPTSDIMYPSRKLPRIDECCVVGLQIIKMKLGGEVSRKKGRMYFRSVEFIWFKGGLVESSCYTPKSLFKREFRRLLYCFRLTF